MTISLPQREANLQKPSGLKRAQRHAQLARKKRQARKPYPHDPKARQANHLAACSCYMCGNPRKHWNELTISEKRQIETGEDDAKSTKGLI